MHTNNLQGKEREKREEETEGSEIIEIYVTPNGCYLPFPVSC